MIDDPGDTRLAIRCASLYVLPLILYTYTLRVRRFARLITRTTSNTRFMLENAEIIGEALIKMQAYGLNQILIGCSQKMIVWKDHRDC